MKRLKQPKLPNAAMKRHCLYHPGAIPRELGLHMGSVYRDDWCGIYKVQRCNGTTDIRLKATMPGNMT
jgi:hypothetical protein